MSEKRALLVVNCINEYLKSKHVLAERGYADFAAQNGTIGRLNTAIKAFREAGRLVGDQLIFSYLAFDSEYNDLHEQSSYFNRAPELGILADDTPSTEIYPDVDFEKGDDICVRTTGLSTFQGSRLRDLLGGPVAGIRHVYISGVATNLHVAATAFAAHDLGYRVTVVTDACVAVEPGAHEDALRILAPIVKFVTADSLHD